MEDEDLIYEVLDKVGFEYISDEFSNGDEFRCAWDEEGSPTSVRVVKATLKSDYFPMSIHGDLITLVQAKLRLSFPQTVRKVADIVSFKETEQIKYELPFGGYYKNIMKLKSDEYLDLETYSESILNQFDMTPNMRFFRDGISYETQLKYKIGYDNMSERIVVPWRSFDGQIAGVMGRLNREIRDDYESKWLPIIKFPKSKTLYGFSENYHSIQEKGICIISESEKATEKLDSDRLPIGLSLGGNNLSEVQANHIKSLFPNKIIIGLDEGLDVDISLHIAKQLKMDSYYKNNVGFIYDKENKYLAKGMKQAPADLPKELMQRLIHECTIWI